MRSWLIIFVSAAAATAAILLFFPGELLPINGFEELYATRWRTVAVPWLSVYGIVALVLNTVRVCGETSKTLLYRSGYGWVGHFFSQLAVTQFFSSVIVLLLIGAVETEHYSVLLTAAEGFLPLITCGALVIAGLIAWLVLSAVILIRSPVPARALEANPEPVMLQEILDLLRAYSQGTASELSEIADLIHRQQGSVLEAVRDVAAAVHDLGRGIRDDLAPLKNLAAQRCGATSDTWSAALSAMDNGAAEMRAAAALLNESLGRVGEIAAIVAAQKTQAVGSPEPANSSVVRPKLSDELKQLLEQMAQPRRR